MGNYFWASRRIRNGLPRESAHASVGYLFSCPFPDLFERNGQPAKVTYAAGARTTRGAALESGRRLGYNVADGQSPLAYRATPSFSFEDR